MERVCLIIQNVKDLLRRDWQVQLLHTLREGNPCADFLVMLGASDQSIMTTFDMPRIGLLQMLVGCNLLDSLLSLAAFVFPLFSLCTERIQF